MPQAPLNATVAKNPSNVLVPLLVGVDGQLLVASGGTKTALDQAAAAVIKAAPGRVAKVIIVAPGSGSGAFTLNDCLTTGAAAAANEVWTLAYNATANVAGAVIDIDWPFLVGIVLSAVPGAGSPIINLSYI
jgi:hypothetical protein